MTTLRAGELVPGNFYVIVSTGIAPSELAGEVVLAIRHEDVAAVTVTGATTKVRGSMWHRVNPVGYDAPVFQHLPDYVVDLIST